MRVFGDTARLYSAVYIVFSTDLTEGPLSVRTELNSATVIKCHLLVDRGIILQEIQWSESGAVQQLGAAERRIVLCKATLYSF